MARIAIGGMQHETNTFAPSPADYAAFEAGGGWPSIQRGAPLFEAVAGANIPVQGAIEALRRQGHTLVPLTWAAASPSAQVTRHAFETIVGDLIERLRADPEIQGVYLDLHGAMVCEHVDDGEGEILRRVREVVGPRVPVVASLDLHANVTRQMVAQSDALTIYRTYPHVDMAATGARAAELLDAMIRTGRRPAKAFRQFDYLTGIPSQCTFIDPCKGLYERISTLSLATGVSLDFAPGFPMADFDECGMSVVAYGPDEAVTQAALREIGDAVAAAESQFAMDLLEPDEAVRRAMQTGTPGAPTVLADTDRKSVV